jgi:hypothetical protein
MPDTHAATYRLTDILTKEVSLVDRAANKRVFLVVKRDAGPGQVLEGDGKGGFTTQSPGSTQATKSGNGEQPVGDPPKPQDPKPAEPPKEPAGDPPPAAATMSKATHAGIVLAIETLTKVAQSVKPEQFTETDSHAVNEMIGKAVSSLGTVVTSPGDLQQPGWMDGVAKLKSSEVKKLLKTASQKLAEVADSLAVDVSDDPTPEEVRWRIYDVLGALVQLSQFETAQAALLKADYEARAFGSMVAGIARAIKSAEAAPAPAPVEKADTVATAGKLLGMAQKVIARLREDRKTLMKRISSLESEPRDSNRLPVEHQEHVRKDVSWPVDMNAKHLKDPDYDFDRV